MNKLPELSHRDEVFIRVADAATDTRTLYWIIVVVAGAIATLGLALNSSAVIIGAMLVAPLLSPLVGLGMGLATGDGRLAIHSFIVVAASTVAVIAVSTLLTLALPFPTLTDEILARTRPTTLDLVIAVFSGVAGAIVTISRSSNLAGAVPGVAVSVALVPPLGVAGFGIGIGWDSKIIRGALLLYGANLAGIVLSAMTVFLIAGMHRHGVLDTARKWHADRSAGSVGRFIESVPGIRSLGIAKSAFTRLALVAAFAVLIAIPLTGTLREISREARVQRAVTNAEKKFVGAGSFVVSHEVVIGDSTTHVFLRVATAHPFGADQRTAFERAASHSAAEPVTVSLEQIAVTSGSAASFNANAPGTFRDNTPQPVEPGAAIADVHERITQLLKDQPLPARVHFAGFDIQSGPGDSAAVTVAYMAPAPLASEAADILAGDIGKGIGGSLALHLMYIPDAATRAVKRGVVDAVVVERVSQMLLRYPRLRVEVTHGARDSVLASRAALQLARAGVDSTRVVLRRETARGVFYQLVLRGPPVQ